MAQGVVGFTAQEAAEGMLALARAGFTAEENIAALPNALNLARTGALGLGEATTILADTGRSFGIAADQSERVADALAKASNIANTDVRLIGESMKHVAATARLTGQGLESVSAALSVMANRGVKGEMAGTALRKVLVELANAKKQASLKTDFGIDVKDARGNMRDVLDVMKELGAATANMGNAEKTSLFRDLFDVRGFQAAATLAENAEEWERFTAQVAEASGTTAAMAKEMDDNIGGSFRLMMSAVEGVQIALGEATQGTIREWMKSVESAALSVSAFVKSNERFVVGVMKLGATLAGAGAAIFTFGKGAAAIGGLVGTLGKLGGGLQALQDRLTGVAEAQKAKAAADKAMEAAGEAHAASMRNQTTAQKAQENAFGRSKAAAEAAASARNQLAAAEGQVQTARQNLAKATQDLAVAESMHMEATLGAVQNTGLAATAERGYAEASKQVKAAQDDLKAAEAQATAARDRRTEAVRRAVDANERYAASNGKVAQAQERTAQAAGKLNSAMYGVSEAQANANRAQYLSGKISIEQAKGLGVVATRGDKFVHALNRIGGVKTMAAAGSVAALAGSVRMLAGDGMVGDIAGFTASMAGSVAALAGFTSIMGPAIAGAGGLGAALAAVGAKAATAAASVSAFLLTNPAGWAILGASALGGLVYGLTRTDNSAVQAAAALKRLNDQAEGMAAGFGTKLGKRIDALLEKTGKINGDNPSANVNAAEESARTLEAERDNLKALQKEMERLRTYATNNLAFNDGGAFSISGNIEFNEKAIKDSVVGAKDTVNGLFSRVLVGSGGSAAMLESMFNTARLEKTGSLWNQLLKKFNIDPTTADEIGLDVTQSWAANTKALTLYFGEYDKRISELRGEDTRGPLDKMMAATESNRQAVKSLADAWDDVLKKIREVAKQRADRARDQEFDRNVENDPFAAAGVAAAKLNAAKANEESVAKRLHELNEARERMAKEGADTDALSGLEADLQAALKEYETAVGGTDVWERFAERADDAVTKTRESIQRLADDSAKLDFDLEKKRGDKRFKDLLRTDWVAASGEVAQAMARVNAEWLSTGRRVAELRAKADAGDVGAHRELESVLKRRGELASERGDWESRDRDRLSGLRGQLRADPAFRKALEDYKKGLLANRDAAAQGGDKTAAGLLQDEIDAIDGALRESRGSAARERESLSAGASYNLREANMYAGNSWLQIQNNQLEALRQLVKNTEDFNAAGTYG